MKKLKLNKIKSIGLNDSELSNVIGGGEARSDRRRGQCSYSRKHGQRLDPCGETTGCGNWNKGVASNPDTVFGLEVLGEISLDVHQIEG
jgi:hypothetical protein